MAVDILMPALSPGMEKGHLARWLKQAGDAVAPGDYIAEIETDKATLELEASEAGVLSEIIVPGGSSDVRVNQRIAVLSRREAATSVEEPKEMLAQPGVGPAQNTIPAIVGPAVAERGGRLFVSPRARSLANELGVDLAGLRGSGPRGRILERNVRDAVVAAMTRLRADVGVAQPKPGTVPIPEAKTTEPCSHIGTGAGSALNCLTSTIEVERLLALLEQINQAIPSEGQEPPGTAVTLGDIVLKAWAQVLSETPAANLPLRDGEATRPDHVDLAVISSDGAPVPVLRRVDRKGIGAIAREARELADRAHAGTLQAEDCAGGTSSVIAIPASGIDSIVAAIHPGHATALACGTVETRQAVRGDAIVGARVMTVTVSLDPRVVGIGTGAALVRALRSRLEAPLSLLV